MTDKPTKGRGRRLHLPKPKLTWLKSTCGGLAGWATARVHRAGMGLRSLRRFSFVRSLESFVVGVTGVGWGALIVCGLSGVLWVTQRWVEAQVITVMLAVLILLAIVLAAGRIAYRVSVRLVGNRVAVGERAVGEVLLANPTSRTLPATLVELPVGAGLASFTAPRLEVGTEHRETFIVPTARRGVVTVGPVQSVRGDALGMIRRVQAWTDPQELYIHPATTQLDTSAIGFIRDVEGVTTQELSSSDVAFHALRDYAPGDDRRNVHWKTTARTGRLMVRQFEETRRAHLLLALDLSPAAWANEDEFETAISCAASLAVSVLRDFRTTTVVTQVGQARTPSPQAALDRFTEFEQAKKASFLPDLVRLASDIAPNASVAVVVTGSLTPIQSIHRAMLRLPVNVVGVALRCDSESDLDRRTIGGFDVLTLASLDQLAAAFRRVLV